jgi:hypothetical protein
MPINLNGSSGVQVPLGSASAPSVSNTSNSNTGLYFPSSTTGAIATNGTLALYVDASQNIGVGTATPGYKLEVAGTAYFPGTTSSVGALLTDVAEVTTVSATAATGTINYDVTTQSVLYYTTNASANWTLNIRGNATTSLNTLMAVNQTLTIAFMVTQGATAYYSNALTIDGVSVTPKYQGGTAWSAGNASGIDVYAYTITKTASATYTVLASQTQFK